MKRAEGFDPPGMRFSGMSQAVRCGEWILVSGQVALKDGQIVGVGDAAVQARQCFENIALALGQAGAELADIVSLRCHLTQAEAYAGYAAAKKAALGDYAPASTTVIVAGLLMPELLMEVEATAWSPQDR